MKISRDARKLSRELFRLACRDGRVQPETARLVADSLLEKKPRYYLQILQEFTRLLRLEMAKTHATVTSATALSPNLENEVREHLSQRFGAETTFSFAVDPALIGGMRVQHGSDVLDGSVLGRIESIRSGL
jgi:F-type H+-transporting ATPase subunit delta